MIKKLMDRLFFSCKHATELVEKKQFVNLSLMETIRLKGHLLFCSACQSYEKQSDLLEKMFHRMADLSISGRETLKMDDTAKAKILAKLKEER